MYARIEKNVVVGMFHTLPAVHVNISGFSSLSADELETYGFYEVQETDGTYDPATQIRTEETVFAKGKVTRTYTITERPLAEVQADIIAGMKKEASRRLALSDWKITRAVEGIKPADQATLDARAAIRARSAEIEAAVLAAADNAAVRACNISFDLGAVLNLI